jgi:hypothetical protein
MRLSASTVIGCDLMGCCLCIEMWFCLVALLFQSVLACHLSSVCFSVCYAIWRGLVKT